MVDNNIMFPQEANWDEIVNNPLFHGTTPTYLSKIYGQVAGDAKKKFPNIAKSEMTSVVMQKYLQERQISFLHIRALKSKSNQLHVLLHLN